MPSLHKKTDTSNIEQKRGKPQLKNRASKRLETINKRQYFDTSKEREHKYEKRRILLIIYTSSLTEHV